MIKVTVCLECSSEYMTASPEVKNQVINGCGAGGWKIDIIPDTLLGLSINEACNIHDWDYTLGLTEADKDAADARFLRNMLTIIKACPWWLKPLNLHRVTRAYAYYQAVRLCGEGAFWAGKERSEG